MKWISLILAGGSSSRMGREKQLLSCGTNNFLEQTVSLYKPYGDVVVVLGYRAQMISSASDLSSAQVIVNDQYEEGMGASLRCGMDLVMAGNYDGLFMTFCDMPHLKPATLKEMVHGIKKHPNHIVQPTYLGKRGHPVYLPQMFFEALSGVEGDIGARHIMEENMSKVWLFEVVDPAVVEDIDSQETYETIRKREDWI